MPKLILLNWSLWHLCSENPSKLSSWIEHTFRINLQITLQHLWASIDHGYYMCRGDRAWCQQRQNAVSAHVRSAKLVEWAAHAPALWCSGPYFHRLCEWEEGGKSCRRVQLPFLDCHRRVAYLYIVKATTSWLCIASWTCIDTQQRFECRAVLPS